MPPAERTRYPLVFRIGFWGCILIAVAVAVRRAVMLSAPPDASLPPQMAALDRWFAGHALLTWVHILSALVLVLLLPLLFWRRTRGSRGLRRVFYPLGVFVGLTAYAMSADAVGGWVERAAVLFFDTLYLVSLIKAFAANRRPGADREEQRWLLRAIAILLGIATTRPVMGVFFATARLTGLTLHQFFGPAFWIGFSINAVAMELWLRRQSLLLANR